MKICTGCREPKPLTDFYSRKGVPASRCKACHLVAARKYREENREKFNACVRAWRKKYPDRAKEADRVKRLKNPEKYREIDRSKRARKKDHYRAILRRWREQNRERHRALNARFRQRNIEKLRARAREFARRNRDKANAVRARRRAIEINATPSWADKKKMAEFYQRAAEMTAETGRVHHVDHIVPLNSPIVCGLHCEFNLQVLEGTENIRKSNRHWPDMPGPDVWEWARSDEFKRQWKDLCSDLPKRARPPSMWETISPEERSRMATERNLAAWSRRSPEQRLAIGRKIAEGQRRARLNASRTDR